MTYAELKSLYNAVLEGYNTHKYNEPPYCPYFPHKLTDCVEDLHQVSAAWFYGYYHYLVQRLTFWQRIKILFTGKI